MRLQGTEEYFPLGVIQQYGWAVVPQALISRTKISSGMDWAIQKVGYPVLEE